MRTNVLYGLSGPTQHQNPRTRPYVRAERDRRILALRGAGVQIEAIAQAVDCNEKTVRRCIAARIAELNRQITLDVASLRAGHLMELQGIRERLRPLLSGPDPGHKIGAVRAWLGVLERESRLIGLDAPAKVELAAQAQAAEALLQRLADRLPPDAMEQIVSVLTDGSIDCA